jgi:hypothetical protein
MPGVLRVLRHTSWVQRVVLLVLGINSILILLGLFVVPSTLTSAAGVGAMLGAAGLQIGLALVVLVGPLSFDHYQRTMVISLGCGVLFAAAYLGILGCEFAGIQLSFDTGPGTIYTVFVTAALLAGVVASVRTRRLRDGGGGSRLGARDRHCHLECGRAAAELCTVGQLPVVSVLAGGWRHRRLSAEWEHRFGGVPAARPARGVVLPPGVVEHGHRRGQRRPGRQYRVGASRAQAPPAPAHPDTSLRQERAARG